VGTKFYRLFISYKVSIDGFVHCRALLGLDRTHLTSKYGGILLAATGADAQGQLFPLAIVSVENDSNWDWFLKNLHSIVNDNLPTSITNIENLTFLSDCQKGLLESVGTWFPGSAHAYCLRHLVDNFSKQYKHKDLTKLLWQAAHATTEDEFNSTCNAMRAINSTCVDWLLTNVHPRHWATVYFPGHRYGHFTSNIAESLNSWLLHSRSLPIEGMLEAIRMKLMG
jgi:zinc finger SWIM domain-containing protein 3